MISKEHAAHYADHNMDGIYYNGGSWMRIEICGYITGKLHGWTKAEAARSLAEVAEHLQTDIEPMLVAKADSTLQGSTT